MKNVLKILVGLVFILVIGSGVFLRNVIFDLKYKNEIRKYATKYSVDPYLIAAVINFETANEELKYEPSKSCGPFNLKDTKVLEYAKEMELKDFKKEDIGNPDINIKIGTWYISKNFKGDYKEFAAKWIERNQSEDDKMKSYAREYYGSKIEKRAKIYKVIHPELK
ncbi:transglycosylase SLT domain-containing protein [Clostridium botulinum]